MLCFTYATPFLGEVEKDYVFCQIILGLNSTNTFVVDWNTSEDTSFVSQLHSNRWIQFPVYLICLFFKPGLLFFSLEWAGTTWHVLANFHG